MNEDCVSLSWQAFFKCGIRIGLRLCRNAQKKNRLVTRIKGTRYLFDLLMRLFKAQFKQFSFLVQLVIDLVPLQLILESMKIGVLADQQVFDTSHVSKIFKVLRCQVLAIASVMCSASKDPCRTTALHVGIRLP